MRISGRIREVNREAISGELTDERSPALPIRLFLRVGDNTVTETVTTADDRSARKGARDNFCLKLAAPMIRRRLSRAISEAKRSNASPVPYLRCVFADGAQIDVGLSDEDQHDICGTLGFDSLNGRDLFATIPNDAQELAPASVEIICFYLPQFHPIKENDVWWGPGFTEWTNVARSTKQFPRHVAPWLPADLGFYDIRLRETRQAQAELAKQYGVSGFCYYVYWFQGRRLLERPLELLLEDGEPDLPFCLCWANENWSRRWDGSNDEVLMAQEHNVELDSKFIDDMAPLFRDERYIRIDGKLIIAIYRPALLASRDILFRHWRNRALELGLGELLICNVMTFGEFDPRQLGCDAAIEFPPHTAFAKEVPSSDIEAPSGYQGAAFDYADVVRAALGRSFDFDYFPGVMPRWDNTPRKGKSGNVFINSTPELFEVWLRDAMRRAETQNRGRKLVFINSWNEWAEGAHLEPDSIFGRAYLAAVHRVATGTSMLSNLLQSPDSVSLLSREELERALRQSAFFNSALGGLIAQRQTRAEVYQIIRGEPAERHTAREIDGATLTIEVVKGSTAGVVSLQYTDTVTIRGASVVGGIFSARYGRIGILVFEAISSDNSAYLPFDRWTRRTDLRNEFEASVDDNFFGLDVTVNITELSPGVYAIGLIEFDEVGAIYVRSNRTIEIVS